MSTFEESHPGARAYNSANISINDGAETALTFDSERYDNDSIHSTVSNTGRLTCQTDGNYSIIGNAQFAANATGNRRLRIRLNATTFIGAQFQPNNGATHACDLNVVTEYPLSVGDYVELMAYQNSGGPLNVVTNGNFSPEFMMRRVG